MTYKGSFLKKVYTQKFRSINIYLYTSTHKQRYQEFVAIWKQRCYNDHVFC